MAKNVISAVCLVLMVLVTGGVIGFYYYSGLEKDVAPVRLVVNNGLSKDLIMNEEKSVVKSFFSHDVLGLQSVCNFSESSEKPAPYLYQMEGCFNTNNPFNEDYSLEEYVWDNKYDFNSLILANQDLGYYVLLNEEMSLFKDIKGRLLAHQLKMDEILAKDSKRTARLLDFDVDAMFDRQNPEIVYVLFSFNEQGYWPSGAEEVNIKDEVLAYAAEIKIYKYNLKTDKFDVLYNAYEIKDNDTEQFVLSQGDLLVAPSSLIGINENNDLMISGGQYYGATGLGGADYNFSFEGLSAYSKLYLLHSGETALTEYKYTQDQNSYNADLFEFLLFGYYPRHFNNIGTGSMDEYKDL